MFTGIIETTGVYTGIRWIGEAGKLQIRPKKNWHDLVLGESIAVNGTCLTLEHTSSDGTLTFHVMRETFTHTNLGNLSQSPVVNMERALCLGSRLGGHLVSGHVDAVADVVSFGRKGADLELRLVLPDTLKRYLVWKGSVCVNGVSLTISDLREGTFAVSLIPTTERETNLGLLKAGQPVNLEADMIGKYVCRQLDLNQSETKHQVTLEDLQKAGF